jgi:hypothetical protein
MLITAVMAMLILLAMCRLLSEASLTAPNARRLDQPLRSRRRGIYWSGASP